GAEVEESCELAGGERREGRGGRGSSTIAGGRPGARPRAADERQGSQGSYGVGVGTICAMPGRVVAPGPGRSNTTARRRGDAEDRPLPRRVRRAIGQVAGGHARLGAAPRAPLAEGAGGALARAAQPVRSGHAPVVRGFRSTAGAPLKSPPLSSGGQPWLVVLVAGFPVVTVVEAGSAGVRSVGPARRTAAAAGRVRSCLQNAPARRPGMGRRADSLAWRSSAGCGRAPGVTGTRS